MSGDATGKFDSISLDKGKLADLLIQTDLFGDLRRPFLDGNVSVKAWGMIRESNGRPDITWIKIVYTG